MTVKELREALASMKLDENAEVRIYSPEGQDDFIDPIDPQGAYLTVNDEGVVIGVHDGELILNMRD